MISSACSFIRLLRIFRVFTLTAALTGAVFGILLYKNKTSLARIIIASAIVCICLNLGLDTLWLHMMYGDAFLAILPGRIIKCMINIPVYVIVIEYNMGAKVFHTSRSCVPHQHINTKHDTKRNLSVPQSIRLHGFPGWQA